MFQRRYMPLSLWHKIFMVLGGIAALWSWKWSYNIFYALFNDIPTAFMIATMITFLELYSIYQLVVTGHWGWILGVSFGFFFSVAGSFGNFQKNFEMNVQKSSAYSRLESEIERLEGQIGDSKDAKKHYTEKTWPGNAKREQNNIDRYQAQKDEKQKQLESMTAKGTGTSNAIFRSIARHFNISALDAAERMNLALGIFVECFMLLSTAISATGMKRGLAFVSPNPKEYTVTFDDNGKPIYSDGKPVKTKEAKTTSPPQEVQPAMAEKKDAISTQEVQPTIAGGSRGIMGFHTSSSPQQPEKKMPVDISEYSASGSAKRGNRREMRKQKLINFLKQKPDATLGEMCEAVGVSSRTTILEYLKELNIK